MAGTKTRGKSIRNFYYILLNNSTQASEQTNCFLNTNETLSKNNWVPIKVLKRIIRILNNSSNTLSQIFYIFYNTDSL